MIVLPLSVTYAQNYNANDIEHRFEDWIGSVSKRLKTAVAAHKLSEEDAWGKWRHFKENELAPRLKAAVKAGKLSEEAAQKIWREIGKAAVAKGDLLQKEARTKFESWIGSVAGKLKTAVETHKLSEEEAWGKWHHFKENEFAPRLKAAVKTGKIHAKTAREIWRELEKAEDNEKLKSAVAKSEISEEEARAKWSEFNKEDKTGRGASSEALLRKYRAIEARIRAAVKTGKMTREAATEKLSSLRKRFQLNDIEKSPARETIAAIKERIWAGVKAGKITEAQAMERWQGYLKRLRLREPNEKES